MVVEPFAYTSADLVSVHSAQTLVSLVTAVVPVTSAATSISSSSLPTGAFSVNAIIPPPEPAAFVISFVPPTLTQILTVEAPCTNITTALAYSINATLPVWITEVTGENTYKQQLTINVGIGTFGTDN